MLEIVFFTIGVLFLYRIFFPKARLDHASVNKNARIIIKPVSKAKDYNYYGSDHGASDRGASDRGASDDGGELASSCCGITYTWEVLLPLVSSVVFTIEKLPRSSSCLNAGVCEGRKPPDVSITIISPNNVVIVDIIRVNWVFSSFYSYHSSKNYKYTYLYPLWNCYFCGHYFVRPIFI
jgi:hypothetical protein